MARIALGTIALNGTAGGIERNICYLANALVAEGHDVSLITFDLPNATSFFELDSRVVWHRVGQTQPHKRIHFRERIELIRRIHSALVRPVPCDYLVCFHHGILIRFLIASLGSGIRIICSERNSLAMYKYIRAQKWNLNFFLMSVVHRITVQFPSYIADYPRYLRNRIVVVHNPVFPISKTDLPREKLILAVGRHSEQKQFDLLIRACARAFQKIEDWQLVIIGDGEYTNDLKREIRSSGFSNRIHLRTSTADLADWFGKATLYCQPSKWEGFPNAQAEAMAHGAIPIGFSSTPGVADLIDAGTTGYLSNMPPSDKSLAELIVHAVRDTANHDQLSKNAMKITEKYTPKSWIDSWRLALNLRDVSSNRQV